MQAYIHSMPSSLCDYALMQGMQHDLLAMHQGCITSGFTAQPVEAASVLRLQSSRYSALIIHVTITALFAHIIVKEV